MVSPNQRIEQEVAVLGDLPREELVARWIKAYGCPPPKGVKRSLLERAAAWHLQARHLGGLSATARKAIRDAAKHGSARASASGRPADSKNARTGNRPIVNPPAPRSGTRLVREWNGRTHVVDVTDDGFVFDGKTYRSLSAVAKRITGAHWSGRRFFGL
ncbi:MAG: DUF2924 domain-containing protein [Mesorhizobium sp.]|nr:DUF2924 domain-containing protein [Mesorhizobium sp.]MBL8576680.1 DUF2924 domain-containing protein [Mesorhizobium sp.]